MTDSKDNPAGAHSYTGSARWELHRQPKDQIADHEFSIWLDGDPVIMANLVYNGDEKHLKAAVDALNAIAQPPRDGAGLTQIAAECHRAKWQFEWTEENRPSARDARNLVSRAFSELHRIGDIALKLRDASTISSTGRRAACQCCGETKDLKCGPSRFGAETWACADCWEPDGSLSRPQRGDGA